MCLQKSWCWCWFEIMGWSWLIEGWGADWGVWVKTNLIRLKWGPDAGGAGMRVLSSSHRLRIKPRSRRTGKTKTNTPDVSQCQQQRWWPKQWSQGEMEPDRPSGFDMKCRNAARILQLRPFADAANLYQGKRKKKKTAKRPWRVGLTSLIANN